MAASLKPNQCETLFDSVATLFGCENLEQFPLVALREISRLVECDHITFSAAAPGHTRVTGLGFETFPVERAAMERAFAQHFADQPLLRHFLATGDTGACKISDFFSVREYHELPLYRHFYQALRCEDQLAFMLFPPGSECITVALARKRRSFTEYDRQILNLLRPSIARAYRRLEELSRGQRGLAENGSPHLKTRMTTVVLDAQDRVIRFGSESGEWMHAFFPDIATEPSRLPDSVTRWLSQAPKPCVAGHNGILSRQREGECLRLQLIPGRNDGERIIVLWLQQCPIATQPSPTRKLTRREIEVLLEVEQGKSNDQISTALSISSLTVRTHLENIFQKLQVPCRTAAVTHFRRFYASAWLAVCWLQSVFGDLLAGTQISPV